MALGTGRLTASTASQPTWEVGIRSAGSRDHIARPRGGSRRSHLGAGSNAGSWDGPRDWEADHSHGGPPDAGSWDHTWEVGIEAPGMVGYISRSSRSEDLQVCVCGDLLKFHHPGSDPRAWAFAAWLTLPVGLWLVHLRFRLCCYRSRTYDLESRS